MIIPTNRALLAHTPSVAAIIPVWDNSLQMAFPEIQFSFNKKKIMVNNFKKYTEMFSDTAIMEKTTNLSYFIAPSEDGFRTNSYINGVNTRQGGTYVDHFMNSIIDSLTVKIKRRHKVEVLKTTIKSGITFVMFARNFVNPKFDSQTKERLTNPTGNIKEHLEICRVKDAEWLANKILNTPDIIDPIIEAQLAKKLAADRRAATLAQKKLRKVKSTSVVAGTQRTQDTVTLF